MEQDEQEKNSNISDSTPSTSEDDSFYQSYFSRPAIGKMTAEQREEYFYLWYNNGRPRAREFKHMIIEKLPNYDFVPAIATLEDYIYQFKQRAFELDKQVHQELQAAVIAEKVEMLKRHAEVGVHMQELALEYIDANKDKISSNSAIRMLIEGVRIERDSKGIPEAMEKMISMSDEELMNEVKKLMTSSSISREELDANS